MLKHISSDQDYLNHLHFNLHTLDTSQKIRLSQPRFKSALHKLKKLRVNLVSDLLYTLYSPIGRPANDPALYLRSFVLMQHLGYSSIDSWINDVYFDSLFQFLIGSSHVPNAASHYDFINRLTHDDPHRSTLFPKDKNTFTKTKLKKGQKLENFMVEDTASLVDAYSINPQWDCDRYSYTLQSLFNAIAVIPSVDLGLIDSHNLTLSGDGSSLHIHANGYGHKIIDDDNVLLTHRFSSPEADIGWDSDLATFYFGFSLYNITNHNPNLGIDLPCFISIEKASRHDALTTISASAQLFDLNPELHPTFMCFDSASDNYVTHEFFATKHVTPIIDINCRRKDKNPFASFESLNKDGIPICLNGNEMVYNGYEAKKHRHKYRCPLAMGKISACPHKQDCCPNSEYGKIRYTKSKDDIKLFGPVPYKSDKWKKIYKDRTSTERMNNRLLNDYNLHNMNIRNRAKNLFFAIFAGINVHLDAQLKCSL